MTPLLRFVVIGLLSGVASGFFGIGGGVLIVPMLMFWAGFSQHRATGTSLAVLLPPVGIAAAIEYYRNGNVDVRAAATIAIAMLIGAGVGAYCANRAAGEYLRLAFGLFVVILGGYLMFGAGRRLGWY
ncbi:MAG TPA: sulfite exporter TauE/SafE family protein [Thermoanaerobaculia bacterium]|nr:sulfite exporter TauE/SafE family protein [Thermoanaerobaculia bacterium]